MVTRHATTINAPRQRVWVCLKTLDLNRSFAARVLFALRRLPAGRSGRAFPLTVEGATLAGFIVLGERPLAELLLGLIGKPWTVRYGARKIAPEEFRSFNDSGYAKIAWSFTLDGEAPAVLLSTQTRVQCLDDESRRRFKLYWNLIRPFSGFIRNEMLRLVRSCAQHG